MFALTDLSHKLRSQEHNAAELQDLLLGTEELFCLGLDSFLVVGTDSFPLF